MKITIESTSKIVQVVNEGFGRSAEVPARVWEGNTESGIAVQCLIVRIGAEKTQDLSEFERELKECRVPSPDVQMFPLRLII